MTGLTNIYHKINEISDYSNVSVEQLPNLQFHINVRCEDVRDGYKRLSVISGELNDCVVENGYCLNTIFGDDVDAVFQLVVDRGIL